MRILITGGTGFIGRNLKEAYADEYDVYAPTHAELDLVDTYKVERYVLDNRIDVIVHGAIHVPEFNGLDNELYNDMLIFANIERLSHAVKKIIYFGSGAEYDKRHDIVSATEDDIGSNIPASNYGIAKYVMNRICRGSENIYNLRLFGVFGKYELWNIKFISNILCKAIYQLPITIRKDCFFDYLYINDLVNIVKWFIMNQPDYHDYNTCSGVKYRLSDIAEIVLQVTNRKLPIRFLDHGCNLEYTGNNQRLKKQLGDYCFMKMRDAIEDLYFYYKNNISVVNYEELKNSR